MTDNEIVKADEQIVKALECCPLDDIGGCRKIDVLDLINRKDAEIERLQCSAKRNGKQIGSLIYHLEQAKSEAYREFAERAYKFLCNGRNWTTFKEQWLENGECIWLKENLSNLAEELTRNLHGTCTEK